MKITKNKVCNKKTRARFKAGDMSIFALIFTFALMMLFVPIYEYSQVVYSANRTEDNITNSMKDVTNAVMINNYDNFKYVLGNNITTEFLDHNELKVYSGKVFETLGFTRSLSVTDEWESDSGIKVSDVDLSYSNDDGCFKLTYIITVPIKILGKTITTADANKTDYIAVFPKN